LLGLVVLGVLFGRKAVAMAANFGHNFHNFWAGAGWHTMHPLQVGVGGPVTMVGLLTILAVVQTGSLFSADAWNNVTYTAGEVKNPKRNLPLSLVLGTGVVLGLYILANFVYLFALPLHGDPHGVTLAARGIQYAPDDRVATAALQQIFSNAGAYLMAGAILISTFGCANGLTLAGPRVYYAMSRDGLFFKAAGKLHPRYKTPMVALVIQGVWTCVLCISGSYSQLLDYIICTELIFYILTIGSLFVLRKKRPDAQRPYKALGYPVLPALYIVMAAWICIVLLRYKPQYTWPGIVIVLLGLPVYAIWSRKADRVAAT
jgi:APA family basic amino acid/polyamine antiporter